jgi:hypothetical protein
MMIITAIRFLLDLSLSSAAKYPGNFYSNSPQGTISHRLYMQVLLRESNGTCGIPLVKEESKEKRTSIPL